MELFKKKKVSTGSPSEGIPQRLQYGTKETATLLAISERTLTSMVSRGDIKSYKLGGKRMFKRKAIEEFVAMGGN